MIDFQYDQALWRDSKPRFIVLEGDEAGGKSTQVGRITEWLNEIVGIETVNFFEPGTGATASQLRSILLGSKDDISAAEEAMLMSAARLDTRIHHVMPALAAGKWVICDRGELSSIVYQGFARDSEGSLVFVSRIQDEIAQFIKRGDLYIVVGISPELSAERLHGTGKAGDRFEGAGNDFRRRVNRGFKMIDRIAPGYPVVSIDGSGSKDDVQQAIITAIEASL